MGAVFFLALGLMMLWLAREGYREGDAPHCAKCNYNLTALTSERCPECGVELGRESIVQGNRRPAPGVFTVGLLLTLGSLFFLGKTLCDSLRRDPFWFRLYPTGIIEDLTQSPDSRTVHRAWEELERRLKADKLGNQQIARLIDLAVKSMVKPSLLATGSSFAGARGGRLGGFPCQPAASFLVTALADGHGSATQKDKFLQNSLAADLQVRNRVRQGDLVPYFVRAMSCGTQTKALRFTGLIERVTVSLDGKPAGSNPVADRWQGRRPTDDFSHSGMLECSRPGKHTIQASVHVVCYSVSDGSAYDMKPFHSTDILLEKSFDVLAAPDDSVRAKPSPSLGARIMSSIAIEHLSLSPEGIEGWLKVQQAPESMAFDVITRVNHREYAAGKVTVAKSDPWWLTTESSYEGMSFRIAAQCPRPPDGKCDIILRPNLDWARETVDIYEIWNGELVFKDVPVETER